MPSARVLKFEKWLIWAALAAVIWLLRDLFPALFLTFVLTWIGHTVVSWLGTRMPRRGALILTYGVLLVVISGLGLLIVPRLFAEARGLARLYIAQDSIEDDVVFAAETELAQRTLPPPPAPGVAPPHPDVPALERETRKYVDTVIIQLVGQESFRSFQASEVYSAIIERAEEAVRSFIPKVVIGVKEFTNASIAITLQFFLSILFSFLILWDLPRLRGAAMALSAGRTSEIYAEIAPGMIAFGRTLGRAFEAQSVIALVNAILTSIAFIILGIPSIALLATIVFFCSYIPVFGVFLSTLPAALIAFQIGGALLVLWLVVAILIVHAVEAYALNPLIYGRHLKLHPVAVLIILLVAEHLFGVWGLLLGVPIAAFVYKYAIKGEDVV
ncbi:MAG TPA: AI-2E family transporter [Thermoanaerobaculia bacterium]|nr:AI-2E family transporter [Thermoanaerobaculia bacterium]